MQWKLFVLILTEKENAKEYIEMLMENYEEKQQACDRLKATLYEIKGQRNARKFLKTYEYKQAADRLTDTLFTTNTTQLNQKFVKFLTIIGEKQLCDRLIDTLFECINKIQKCKANMK